MSKKRVYELAREVGLESKIVIQKLKDLGIPVASHQSALDEKQVIKFHGALSKANESNEAGSTKKPVVRRRKKAVVVAPPEPVSSEKSSSDATPEVSSSDLSEQVTEESVFGTVESSSISTKTDLDKNEKVEEDLISSSQKEVVEEIKDDSLKPSSSVPDQNSLEKAPDVSTKVETVAPSSELKPKESVEAKGEEKSSTLAEESSSASKTAKDEATQDDSQETKRKEPVKATLTPTRKFQGGATIVRRATKEESEALQMKESHRYKRKDEGPSARAPQGGSARPPVTKRREYSDRPPQGGADRSYPRTSPSLETSFSSPRSSETKFSGSTASPGKFDSKKPATSFSDENRSPKTYVKQKRSRFSSSSDFVDDASRPSSPKRRMRVFSNSDFRGRGSRTSRASKLKKTEITVPRQEYRIVKMEKDTMAVSELASQLNVKAAELIKKLMAQGVMATVNQEVDADIVSLIAGEYNFECKSVKKTEAELLKDEVVDPKDLQSRPPIITVMGHVDHGKTSILDAIRNTGVADKEAGGITQHIGAYMVQKGKSKLTFLDTPGHEAFSAMRSRGAKLTDLVILVVAADDGVMPQTIEAIAHAKASNVPMVVAVNKIDKENVNFDRIYSELSEQGIQAESWGGDTQFVHVSALKNEGLDELLEAVQLQAELLDLKATEKGPASGTVVEAHLDKGRGAVATMIVTQGTLSIGDLIVAGSVTGRVRAMIDHDGKRLKKATPSMPVEIIGLGSIPLAADPVNVVPDDKVAREVSELRLVSQDTESVGVTSAQSLDDLLGKVQAENIPQISVLLKADTQGTVEAIADSIAKLKSDKVAAKIIYKAVGGITESDLNLAETCGAVIMGFNVRMSNTLLPTSEKKGVVVQYFSVIYKLVDAVKGFMAGKLPPITEEVVQGHAEVKEAIRIPKIGLIAGSNVTDGKVTRNSHLRLIRNDVVIHSGKLSALKRFKDDVKEVMSGYECGISFENCTDIKAGDIIESYTIVETPAELDI